MDEDDGSIGSGAHGHNFYIRTFSVPIKCFHCTSLMIGVERQGTVCEGLHPIMFILLPLISQLVTPVMLTINNTQNFHLQPIYSKL